MLTPFGSLSNKPCVPLFNFTLNTLISYIYSSSTKPTRDGLYIYMDEEKIEEAKDTLETFFGQFGQNDLYTQTILEMIFEEMFKKNEK